VGELISIYQDHREGLFHYLLRMTSDYDLSRDIMQESFARCLERYGTQIDSVALLYRIARNLVIDSRRKQSRSEPMGEREVADPANEAHQMMIREEYRNVLAALQQLRFEDRELLSLVAGEALAYREIASLLDTNESAIKVRVHRARKRLCSILAKRGER
jgi:RNA polymerase sigma factor (sigma-70 family)